MHSDLRTESWFINVSVALVICGMLFLIYGMVATSPTLYGFLLIVRADLLGNILAPGEFAGQIRALHAPVAGYAPGLPQSFLYAGSLLIAGGVCIDVWRRMKRL